MYGPGPVPFNDGYAVASIYLSIEYEVILLTSEGRKVRCHASELSMAAMRRRTRTDPQCPHP